jgi:hypothetical protein
VFGPKGDRTELGRAAQTQVKALVAGQFSGLEDVLGMGRALIQDPETLQAVNVNRKTCSQGGHAVSFVMVLQ